MSFAFGTAADIDAALAGTLGRAMRRTGRRVALVVAGRDLHGGQLALLQAAHRLRGAVTVLALDEEAELDESAAVDEDGRPAAGEHVRRATLAACGVDAVLRIPADDPAATGRTLVTPEDRGMAPQAGRAAELTRILAAAATVAATDVFIGEKDYELLVDVQHAATDLHLPLEVHGHPTVRMPDGLALSLRNTGVPAAERERAVALSAALTAGAHLSEKGAQTVLSAARGVLDAAGIEPLYLQLRSHTLGPAPEEGDARLLAAADFGGVVLTDNVGVPLGIGFTGLAERA